MNIIEPINQQKLFGLDNYFLELIRLYKNNIYPNKLLLSGQKGIGKSTLAYHFINYILSENEDQKYDLSNFEINSNSSTFKTILNGSNSNLIIIDINSDKKFIEINQIRDLIRNLNTYNNAIEVLIDLSLKGHEIVIISSKPWWSIHDTPMWLGENKVPSKEIHFTEDKWKVSCDVYIDDAPHQLENFVKNVPDKLILRFIRPYNRFVEGTVDLKSWEELSPLLENYNL